MKECWPFGVALRGDASSRPLLDPDALTTSLRAHRWLLDRAKDNGLLA
jgi:hypothetical protein